jgi:hypothetical protein
VRLEIVPLTKVKKRPPDPEPPPKADKDVKPAAPEPKLELVPPVATRSSLDDGWTLADEPTEATFFADGEAIDDSDEPPTCEEGVYAKPSLWRRIWHRGA